MGKPTAPTQRPAWAIQPLQLSNLRGQATLQLNDQLDTWREYDQSSIGKADLAQSSQPGADCTSFEGTNLIVRGATLGTLPRRGLCAGILGRLEPQPSPAIIIASSLADAAFQPSIASLSPILPPYRVIEGCSHPPLLPQSPLAAPSSSSSLCHNRIYYSHLLSNCRQQPQPPLAGPRCLPDPVAPASSSSTLARIHPFLPSAHPTTAISTAPHSSAPAAICHCHLFSFYYIHLYIVLLPSPAAICKLQITIAIFSCCMHHLHPVAAT
ncbi:hypothetical protein B296_00024185 [Ensete ventricosum]|uniref:Uncharacterized protein n=1 Tax=Ensete ventricosum TaxID=4639 RepID=A0A427A214_ENSVE|nr:hypothetical protein B296_00024185 [Ensete ventricosum]